MTDETVIETLTALRDGLKGSNIPPPYKAFVPPGTLIGIDLAERVLKIDGIKAVSVGKGSSISLQGYKESS